MTHIVSTKELLNDDGFIVAEDVLAMTTRNGGKWLSYRLVTNGSSPQAGAVFVVRVGDRNSRGQEFNTLAAAVDAYNNA